MRTPFSLILIILAQIFWGADAAAQTQTPACPSIRILDMRGSEGREAVDIYTDTDATLAADVSGLTPEDKPTFNWTISSGKVVGGQGTSRATVWTDAPVGMVTVAVEVGGVSALGPQCSRRVEKRLIVTEYFCPSLSIKCEDMVQEGQPVSLSLNVIGGDPYANLKYNWTVSAGEIIGGQGTTAITVNTTGLAGQDIKATVEVDGLPSWCDRTESCQLSVVLCMLPVSRLVHTYGDLSESDEKARLDDFAVVLKGEPGATGYVTAYGGGTSPDALAHLERIRKYLEEARNVEPGRVTVEDAGPCRKPIVELYVRPPGAVEPVPAPCP